MNNNLGKQILLILLGVYLSLNAESYSNGVFQVDINSNGKIDQILIDGINFARKPSDLLKIKRRNKVFSPTRAHFSNSKINLIFQDDINIIIKVQEKNTHLTFEIVQVNDIDKIGAIVWGPYHITIAEIVGEFVGVSRNNDYAIGIQSLNPKTVGGFPINDEGAIFSRGITAVKVEKGSKLQAFSLNRHKDRKIDVWSEWGPRFTNMPVPPIKGETVVGSKIALFGCKESKALDRIGEIEVAEGLPHPMYEGKWLKKHPEAGRGYMITYFTEENIDEMLEWAKIGGFTRMYHEGPFRTWGHFELNEDAFPNGYTGMKNCVDNAKKEDIIIGTHFLTNFLTTNDKYITPTPDDRLAVAGYSQLSKNIDATQRTIPVESPEYFNLKSDWMHSAVIGDEIVRYQKVTTEPPYELVNCQRGAFGTRKASHKKGIKVDKLVDHGYKVFFPNYEMQEEVADNIVKFLNETGVQQIDFDGHEGCYASGQGDFAMDMFAKQVYDGTNQELINGSSRSNHYYWHMLTYLNWGEPWYGGFRESQLDTRLKNQALLERNFLPNMLGWFLLTESSTVSDIEWMMARAAGFDAGFALVARSDALAKNPKSRELLTLVKIWEEARLNKVFTEEQRKLMRDANNEFHLEKIADTEWKLYPFTTYSFSHDNKILQPGQPTYSEWRFETTDETQPLNFSLTLKGEKNKLVNIYMELDYNRIEFPIDLECGETIVYNGKNLLKKYNKKGKMIDEAQLESGIPDISPGSHFIQFDGNFENTSEASVELKIKTISSASVIKK